MLHNSNSSMVSQPQVPVLKLLFSVKQRQAEMSQERNQLTQRTIDKYEEASTEYSGDKLQDHIKQVSQKNTDVNQAILNNIAADRDKNLFQARTNKNPLTFNQASRDFMREKTLNQINTKNTNISEDVDLQEYPWVKEESVDTHPGNPYGSGAFRRDIASWVNVYLALCELSSVDHFNNDLHAFFKENPAIFHPTPVFSTLTESTWLETKSSENYTHVWWTLHAGYAFGGQRRENNDWHNDPIYGPEDCASLLAKVFELPVEKISTTEFANCAHGVDTGVPSMNEAFTPVSVEQLQRGDVIVTRWGDTGNSEINNGLGRAGHSAMILEHDQTSCRVIHASRNLVDDSEEGKTNPSFSQSWPGRDMDGFGVGEMLLAAPGKLTFFLRPNASQLTPPEVLSASTQDLWRGIRYK